MKKWPAIDVTRAGDAELPLAIVDDFGPTAVEPHGDRQDVPDTVRLFFATETARNQACAALVAARFDARPIDLEDEDWARRSQEGLGPVTVGRLTIAPPWVVPGGAIQPPAPSHQSPDVVSGGTIQPPAPSHQPPDEPIAIVIQPSMGFGTGHHATTRLCLRALQACDLLNRFVVDIGTGSGILAIAAVRLGAARAVGIDNDPDAIQSANENLVLNHVGFVEFQVADLSAAALPLADVVTANLTGAVLARSARLLLDLLQPGGTLIVSGLLKEEREDVVGAFAGPDKVRSRPVGRTLSGPPIVWEQEEEGWSGIAFRKPH